MARSEYDAVMSDRRKVGSLAGAQSVGYIIAVAATVALTYATVWLALPPFVLDHLVILVILGVALGWGLGPAVVAVIAAVTSDNVLIREPVGWPTVTGARNAWDLLLFATVAVVVSGLVTRAHRARLDAEAAATRERQVREGLDHLIATVAHDLATPLQVLDASVRFATRKGAADVDWVRLLERLGTASTRATSLVRTLSEARGVEAYALPLTTQIHDLRALVSPIVKMMDRYSERHPVLLAAPETVVPVEADGERIQRVLENLVNNAIKYSPDGGTVEVTILAEGKDAVLRVRDYGIGITSSALPHVFARSFRAPEAWAQAPGLGLGLSVAAEVVAKHRGTIAAAPAEGRGTVMTVRLPLATTSVANTPATQGTQTS
jgi:signal transduction histidine kinase